MSGLPRLLPPLPCWPLLLASILPAAEPPPPDWIWTSPDRIPAGQESGFHTSLDLPAPAKSASLKVTSDYAHVSVFINERLAAVIEPFDPPLALDARHLLLEPGRHTLRLAVRGIEGPSAVAARLEVATTGDESSFSIATGSAWLCSGSDQPAHVIDAVHPRRWADNKLPEVSPFAEYNQWKEALPGDDTEAPQLKSSVLSPLPEGFEIRLIRAAEPGEDSWVSVALDARDRVLIGQEQRGILRLSLTTDGLPGAMERINEDLAEPRGIRCLSDGSILVNANRAKALFHLRDSNGDGLPDQQTEIMATEGGTGHGRNDLLQTADGIAHLIHGDDVRVPPAARLLTVREPEGEAPLELGHWASWKPGSTEWIVRCRGLRNPFGIDLNSDGECFAYDADNEGDAGLPFYLPTRINHLVSGANYGWRQLRNNTRSLPEWAPDTPPTTLDVGRGSPTAVRFGTRSNFPAPWREALFALDWAYGRILVVHLLPRGASYHASGGIFLSGRPLNVTGIDFDSKGNLWFATGGRKTRSALYRISFSGQGPAPERENAQESAREQPAAAARALRKSLEDWHGRVDSAALDAAWPRLGSDDPWIRQAARVALEHQPVAAWKHRALTAPSDLGGLTALLALARQDAGSATEIAGRLPDFFTLEGIPPRTGRLTILRILSLTLAAAHPLPEATTTSLAAQIAAWVPALDESVNREVSRVLCQLAAPNAVAVVMSLLADASSQQAALHHLEMLSSVRIGWDLASREIYLKKLGHALTHSHGDRFMPPYFDQLVADALANIPEPAERERWQIELQGDPASSAPLTEPPAGPRPFVKNWTMADFDTLDTEQLATAGDPGEGRRLFHAVLCARCHIAGGEGRPGGPDLSTVAARFTVRDFLHSVIEPSAVISESYRDTLIRLKDGGTLTGRVIRDDFRESTLHIAPSALDPGLRIQVKKENITDHQESPVSPMPPALLNTLSLEEIQHLLSFIFRG